MKAAIAVKNDFAKVSAHPGMARFWLVFDADGREPPLRVTLDKGRTFHFHQTAGAHPLDGAVLIIAANAGDGFARHMEKRGARLALTGEADPHKIVSALRSGEDLPPPTFNSTKWICKVKDLFAGH